MRLLSTSHRLLINFLGLLILSTGRPVHGQDFLASLFSFLSAPCNSNPEAERCGMGYTMYSGAANTIDCFEKCAIFPIFNVGYTCGSCGPIPTREPSTTTAPIPATTPISTEGTPAPITPSSPVAQPPVAQPPVPPPTDDGSYKITLDLVGETSLLSISEKLIFEQTTAMWEKILTADLGNIPATELPAGPKFTGCRYPTTIDDLYICVRVAKDDGPGNTLGYASPTYQRTENLTSISGYINLDVDDVKNLIAKNTFGAVFAHEIGHILGIGTYFFENGIAGAPKNKCPYFGPKATAEYKKISNCDKLPMENDGGGGTYCSHWDEECLKLELMTGYISLEEKNLLSRISIASLEDLGYKGVDYTTADRYTRFDLGSGCTCLRRNLQGSTSTLFQSSSSDRRHRKLSEETRQYAIQQGLKFLRESNDRPPAGAMGSLFNNTANTTGSWADSQVAKYVGDWMVSVLVQDDPNGDIFGVHVYNPDYFPS